MTRIPLRSHTAGYSGLRLGRCNWASLWSLLVCFAIYSGSAPSLYSRQLLQEPPPATQGPAPVTQTSDQLQTLVAPIALYPDSLVAQILAASTYPEQVVQADRWVQAHPGLKGDALGKAVDQQPWDPSVKALAAFPAILGNMDKNLSWTSSLGDAYYNQQQDVMDAVQIMRKRAQGAGNLKTTPQQTIAAQGSTITIEPADPEIVYIPAYDPWSTYGIPMAPWPGWYEYPGIWFGGPNLVFGLGFGIGFYGGFEWGWPRWGFDWHNRAALYNHNRYHSMSRTFYNRNSYYRGNGAGRGGPGVYRGGFRPDSHPGPRYSPGPNSGRGAAQNRPSQPGRAFGGTAQIPRGNTGIQGRSGDRSGAFSGYQHGGQTRDFSSRGSGSLGGAPRNSGPRSGGGAPRSGGAPRGGAARGGGGRHH